MSLPIFDTTRPDPHDQRHVQHETAVTMRVDESDEWISVPVRAVFTAVFTDDGLSGGPYSISGSDATELVNALAHYGRLAGGAA